MAILHLEYLSDDQRDKWLDHVLPLIAGITDRREAGKILRAARKERLAEATEKVRAKYPDKTEDEIASLQAEILRQTTWGRELLKRHNGKSTT